MTQMTNGIKRAILYKELHQHLKRLDSGTKMEALFSDYMDTKRKFRADFMLPNLKIIVEVNGGQFIQSVNKRTGEVTRGGRHQRGGSQYETDLLKLNIAAVNGWRVLQFTYQQLERGEHLKLLKPAI